jgi:amidase
MRKTDCKVLYDHFQPSLNVPRECGILSDMDIEITEKFDAVALVQAIATAKFTAEQVAIAFCKRAAIA